MWQWRWRRLWRKNSFKSSRRWRRERNWRVWGRQRSKVEYKFSLGLLCEALRLLHGESLWQVFGEDLRLLHDEALRQVLGETLQLQNGTTALLLTGAVVLLCYGDVTVQLLCCGGCFNESLHSFKICIILINKNTCILKNHYYF